MMVQRVVMPVSGTLSWTVVDALWVATGAGRRVLGPPDGAEGVA